MFQGCLALAVCRVWALRAGRRDVAAAIAGAAAAAIPVTLAATWAFERTAQQAKVEASLASIAVLAGLWFCWSVRRAPDAAAPTPASRWPSLIASIAIVVVVRQTMEIGVVVHSAAVTPGAGPLLIAVVEAIAVALAACVAWLIVGRRLPLAPVVRAAQTFAVLFLAQASLYAFHEASEAGVLPASAVLHAATEPYGPDSSFGIYVSWLLLLAPAAVAAWVSIADVATDSVTILAARGLLAAGCAVGAAFATGLVPAAADPPHAARVAAPVQKWPRDVERFLDAPHLLFRQAQHTDGDFGHVAVAGLAVPDTERAIADLMCARVSFGGDRGVCIQRTDEAAERFNAVVFDKSFHRIGSLPLDGTPSRTRTSADGRFGATTTFPDKGAHSYATVQVSTKTMLFDLRAIAVIGDLEEFSAFRNGARFKEADFNYWGVTFSSRDSNTFYATLRTGTINLLVRGDVAKRRVDVIAEDVECPSLSPDERRIAFKRRENQQLSSWRLHVLDLSTLQTSRIEAAANYVDDQVEWLDNDHVLFALPHMGTADIWVAPIAGAGRAQVFVHDAESPIVVRSRDGAARESIATTR
jgi:hypothetical protein